jgi:hypothetical protein
MPTLKMLSAIWICRAEIYPFEFSIGQKKSLKILFHSLFIYRKWPRRPFFCVNNLIFVESI